MSSLQHLWFKYCVLVQVSLSHMIKPHCQMHSILYSRSLKTHLRSLLQACLPQESEWSCYWINGKSQGPLQIYIPVPASLDVLLYRMSPQTCWAKGLSDRQSHPLAHPSHFLQRKMVPLRMIIGCRAVNELPVKNSYPIPNIDDLLHQLQGASCSSLLELSFICQRRMCPRLRSVLRKICSNATRCPLDWPKPLRHSRKEWTLPSAPFWANLLWYTWMISWYTTNSKSSILSALQQVLSQIRESKFYAKLSKWESPKHELNFLGYLISAEGVKVNPGKLKSVQEWSQPTDLKELRPVP